MQFVVLNHYNDDNSLFIGDFEPAFLGFTVSTANVSVTNTGVTFFLLPKLYDLEGKLKFAARLHEKLFACFGYGLAAAIGAEAIGTPQDEFGRFYEGIRKIRPLKESDPPIRTLHCGLKMRSLAEGKTPLVDVHIAELMPQVRILKSLLPTDADRREPSGCWKNPSGGWEKYRGWEEYENTLFKLFAQVKDSMAEKIESTCIETPISDTQPQRPRATLLGKKCLDILLGTPVPAH
jgi:hypothetical protein